jgi:hypothetical protein
MPVGLARFTLLAGALAVAPLPGTAHVGAGEPVENATLATAGGGRQPLLGSGGKLAVLFFWKPGQERSRETLRLFAGLEAELSRKAHLATVVPGTAPPAEARAQAVEAGLRAPVLVDEEDRVYGRLELRQHPAVVYVDAAGKVAAVEPYLRLRFQEIVRARTAFLLGEIDRVALERVLDPPRAGNPTEVAGGSAARYVKLGNRELAKGNCALALRAFEKALGEDPGNAEARAGQARCPPGQKAPLPAR